MAGVGRKPNTNLPPGPDTNDRAYAAMIARAKALIPKLRDRASRTEEDILRKRLTATLLLGGHLLFAFPPVAALATPAPPAGPPATGSDHALSYDDHYRCMYHCAERGYGRDDRYRRHALGCR